MAAMASYSRTLEITVLSAENLRLDGKSVKKNTYVIVQADSNSSTSRSTKADYEGGSNPSWNEKHIVDVPMHARFIDLQVKCRKTSSGSGDRIVGTASVPVSDILGDHHMPQSYLHFLSYRLRDTRGEKNGIINVSARIINAIPAAESNMPSSAVSKNYLTQLGYSPRGYGCSQSSWWQPSKGVPVAAGPDGKNYHGGVVTGVPIWG